MEISQFQRTQWLIGKENMDMLKNRRVAVFGIGGVGGHAAEALCRCGIGFIDLFDGDVVDITNINRQLIATHKTVGRNKTDVMKERLSEINPGAVIGAFKIFYLPKNAGDIDLSVYDYVIDAVDTMIAKIELVCRTAAVNVPLISSMGAANKLDPTAFEVADIFSTSVCPLAKIMRSELRKRGVKSLKVVYSKEPPRKNRDGGPVQDSGAVRDGGPVQDGEAFPASSRPPPASISFVPPVAGLILAGEVIKDLCFKSGHT